MNLHTVNVGGDCYGWMATRQAPKVLFRDPTPSGNLLFPPEGSHFERRRTPHPHNPPFDRPLRAPESMSNRSQSLQRPRLLPQASQTIIDLTDEPVEVPAPVRSSSHSQRPQRPPQLGRSDATDLADIIDLTDDIPSPEIQITHSRRLPPPIRPRSPPPAPRMMDIGAESPIMFMPRGSPAQADNGGAMFQTFAGTFNRFDMINRVGAMLFQQQRLHDPHHRVFAMDHDINFQAMPGPMDYQHPAHARNQKPEHHPPLATREGFTRSPTETDTLICPGCEEELIHKKDKDDNEPVTAKKSGRALTRKEREEHPFWVVKECGHVYCNNCFQFRSSNSKSPVNTSFPSVTKAGTTKKTLMCAVEDCESDVKNKDKWVGVFL